MQLITPIISMRRGSSFEHSFRIEGAIPEKARASAFIRSLMDNSSNVVLESEIDRGGGALKVRLNSARTLRLTPGRYSYFLEMHSAGDKIQYSNYLLIEP